MLETIISWVLPVIFTSCLGYIIKELKSNHQNNISMRKSTIILLRSQITSKVEQYMTLGYLPNYARSCLEELYQQYQSLGGNHGIYELIDQCFKLPPLKPEK